MFKTFTLCTLAAALFLGVFYIGISRDLCSRDNISPAEYADMKLNCTLWIYQ
jgi:hypothetical protein